MNAVKPSNNGFAEPKFSDCFDDNTELLQKALNGDKEAINVLEYLTNNKK